MLPPRRLRSLAVKCEHANLSRGGEIAVDVATGKVAAAGFEKFLPPYGLMITVRVFDFLVSGSGSGTGSGSERL
ncbi:hypothetical protein Tco_0689335 [Tanacetum coccineum]